MWGEEPLRPGQTAGATAGAWGWESWTEGACSVVIDCFSNSKC